MGSFGALSVLQYVPGDSLMHRLDPRSKYGFVIGFSITLVFSHSLITCLICAVIALFLYLLSKLRFLLLWKNMQGVIIVLLLLGYFQASLHGIEAAARMTLKTVSFFLMVTLTLSTTPPEKQMEGLRKILSPLRRLGVKTESFVLMFNVAVLYLPLLLEDLMRMMQAQKARRLQRGRRNWAVRGKDTLFLLTPLLLLTFRRAERLSEAMESRCYSPRCERSAFYVLRLGRHDVVVLILAVLLPFILLFPNRP